jgi:hypothetical protein
MSASLKWIAIIGLIIAIPWGGCQLNLHYHRLSFVPEAMGVSHILYAAEQSWGFGPGGNETGIIVYEMPKAVAEQLEARGLAYLQSLPQQPGGDWHGRYDNWRPTPVVRDRRWPKGGTGDRVSVEGGPSWISPGIGDYMFFYGFEIPLDLGVERMVNEAIFTSGGYYAYGRIGMIILIPAAQRIVYAYNG